MLLITEPSLWPHKGAFLTALFTMLPNPFHFLLPFMPYPQVTHYHLRVYILDCFVVSKAPSIRMWTALDWVQPSVHTSGSIPEEYPILRCPIYLGAFMTSKASSDYKTSSMPSNGFSAAGDSGKSPHWDLREPSSRPSSGP